MSDVNRSKLMIISILVLDHLTQHCKKEIGIIEILKSLLSRRAFLNVQSLKLVSILTHGTENMCVRHTTRGIYAVSVQKDVRKRISKTSAQIAHLAY